MKYHRLITLQDSFADLPRNNLYTEKPRYLGLYQLEFWTSNAI